MSKPRIIIADTDASYILPLQLKFVEEFFDDAEIEIITDQEYFDALFSSPQKADVVIVSENLYSSNLQRHNISYLFELVEDYDAGATDELSITKLMKYTSVKEIFNIIKGKSADVLNIEKKEEEPQIIMVYSASGGTGKTTIALGMSACLAKNYKKVLYINASNLQTFQRYMDNQSPITGSDLYTKIGHANEDIYNEIKHVIRKEGFNYVPPFKAAIMSLGVKFDVYGLLAQSAKKSQDYDFIIVDSDSEFDNDKAKLMNIADKVIVVTRQTETSVYATNLLASYLNGAVDKLIYICNQFDKNEDNALISPSVSMNFSINEYVDCFDHYDHMGCDDFAKNSSMQKAALLVL